MGKHHAGIFFESDNPEDLCRAMREMTSVSYTHLDVYKRQLSYYTHANPYN